VEEVCSKQPEGSCIRALIADVSWAKFDENSWNLKAAELSWIVEGMLKVKEAEEGVSFEKELEPIMPPEFCCLGKPFGSTLIGRVKASSKFIPLDLAKTPILMKV
jgi:hypothetical protein